MFTRITVRRAMASLAAGAFVILLAPHADARGWTVAGRNGKTYSRAVTPYNNGGGNVGRTATTTRPNGQTATTTFNRSVNNETVTDSRTVSGFNGATASSTATRTPGQGVSATHTGPGGQTYSATTAHYNNGNGNVGHTTTVNGPAGTTTKQLTQTNNSNGTYTDTRTVNEPSGQTYTSSYTRY
jgi:hypothetical protein